MIKLANYMSASTHTHVETVAQRVRYSEMPAHTQTHTYIHWPWDSGSRTGCYSSAGWLS